MQNNLLLIAILIAAVIGLLVGFVLLKPTSNGPSVSDPTNAQNPSTSVPIRTPELADVAIRVNGARIEELELEFATHAGLQVFSQLYQQLGLDYQEKLLGTSGEYQKLQHEAQAADELIRKRIVAQEIAKRSITISAQEIDAAYAQKYQEFLEFIFGISESELVSFLEDPLNRQQFQQALFEAGLLYLQTGSFAEFQSTLRSNAEFELKEQALKRAVVTIPTPNNTELLDYVEKNRGRYAARLVEAVVPDDAELESYFQSHQDQYPWAEKFSDAKDAVKQDYITEAQSQILGERLQEARAAGSFPASEEIHARHIFIALAPDATEEVVMAAKSKLEGLIVQLQQGADFAELAKANSEDPSNRDQGGDLGWFGHGMMVPEFDQAAFALAAGETSGIVRSVFGLHVIQVLERRASDTIRKEIEDALANEQIDAKFTDWATERSSEAKVEIFNPVLAGYFAERKAQQSSNSVEQFRFFNEALSLYEQSKSNPVYVDRVGFFKSRIYLLQIKAFEAQLASLGTGASMAERQAIEKRIAEAKKLASASFLQSQFESWDQPAFEEMLLVDLGNPELRFRFAQFLYDEKYDLIKSLEQLQIMQRDYPDYQRDAVASLIKKIEETEGISADGKPGRAVDDLGRDHIPQGATHPAYNSVPPTSGWHYASLAPYGISEQAIADEMQIHNLEHGAVILQYSSDADAELVEELTAFVTDLRQEQKYCRLMLAPYQNLDQPIALTAWTRILKLDEFDHSLALGFIESFLDKGPEHVNDCSL